MGAVIRTAAVVFGILWAVSTLAPDAPRVEMGAKTYTLKMRDLRQGFFVVGALVAGVVYAMRRDRAGTLATRAAEPQPPGVPIPDVSPPGPVPEAADTPLAWEQFFKPLTDRLDAFDGRLAALEAVPPTNAATPKPRRRKPANKTGGA